MLYFIVNKGSRSGKGEAVWQEIENVLKQRNITYEAFMTEYEGHAMKLAEEICEQEDDDICLVVVGGDGTANEVVNGMNHFDRVRFGTIPTGSGNDLARGLGINGTPTQSLERILRCMESGKDAGYQMDLGQVVYSGCKKPRLFIISSGIGLDALVCKKALKSKIKVFLNKIHLGKLTYIVITLQSLITMDKVDASVSFEKKTPHAYRENIAFAAMNLKAQGGGVKFAPHADPADGKLSACSIYRMSKLRALFSLPFLVVGKHLWIPGCEVNDCTNASIHLKRPMVLHADGEYCGDVTDAEFTCLPKKLCVLL